MRQVAGLTRGAAQVYRAHHPSIAVGFAVTNFMRDNCRTVIRDIEILKRIDK